MTTSPIKIRPLNELPTDVGHRILLLGGGSTGKTHIGGTFHAVSDLLMVTSDSRGLDTLRGLGINPNALLIEDYSKIFSYYDVIRSWAAEKSDKPKVFFLDDLGSVQDTSKEGIASAPIGWDDMKQQQNNPKNYAISVQQQRMRGTRKFEFQQWGQLTEGMRAFMVDVFKLKGIDYWVYTCLTRLQRDPRTNEERLVPNLQGDARNWLGPKFSIEASTFVHEENSKQLFCASSRSHKRMETKDRLYHRGDGTPGRTWVDPTGEALMAHMSGKGKPESKQELDIGMGI